MIFVLFVNGDGGVAESIEVNTELAERGKGVIKEMIEVGEPMDVDELGLPRQRSGGSLGSELGGEAGLADTRGAIEGDDLPQGEEVGSQPGSGAWREIIGDGIGVHLKRHGVTPAKWKTWPSTTGLMSQGVSHCFGGDGRKVSEDWGLGIEGFVGGVSTLPISCSVGLGATVLVLRDRS